MKDKMSALKMNSRFWMKSGDYINIDDSAEMISETHF
jgi:hypothetical protein